MKEKIPIVSIPKIAYKNQTFIEKSIIQVLKVYVLFLIFEIF